MSREVKNARVKYYTVKILIYSYLFRWIIKHYKYKLYILSESIHNQDQNYKLSELRTIKKKLTRTASLIKCTTIIMQ